MNIFVSFCKPNLIWSYVIAIGTYLLWVLQGKFFSGTVTKVTNDHKLVFLSKRYMCLSSPQYTSDVEGQLRKKHGRADPIRWIAKILLAMTFIHQKGALSYEMKYGSNGGNPSLTNRIPPDKFKVTSLCKAKDLDPKSLNNTQDDGEVIHFDSDSVNLYIDSCVTGGLTGFKTDFVDGTYVEVEERSSDTTTGKTSIIGEGIAAYSIKDDNGDDYTIFTKMSYAPSSKYRLMAPQWLGMQDKERGIPKEKRSRCELDDEEAVLILDERRRRVIIKHDPKMLVPVLNVNPGIKNYQSFDVAFHNVI